MKVFSGSSNKPLAGKIAKELDLDLSPLEIYIFADGEKRIRIGDSVLDKDTLIIQTTSTPVDTNYMELFLTIDALKRSGAKSVKALIPYFGYQRQDHIFRDGEVVSLEVIAEILEKVGMNEMYSFDLHSVKIPEIFKIPVHHLSALPVFADKIKKDFQMDEIVLVSPDMGGIRRIKEIAEMLGNIPFATVTKNRNLENGQINDSNLDGDVKGKTAIIVDDMVSTGETVVEACNLLLQEGVQKVFVFATHAVFSKNASKILQNSRIERVFVTDTIEVTDTKMFPKLEIVSIAKEAAKALKS